MGAGKRYFSVVGKKEHRERITSFIFSKAVRKILTKRYFCRAEIDASTAGCGAVM